MSTPTVRPSRKTPPPEISATTPPLTPPQKSLALPSETESDDDDRAAPSDDPNIPDSYVQHIMRTTKPLPPVTWSNFYKEINWLNFVILTVTPVLAVYGFWTVKLYWKTAIFSVLYYFFTGLGVYFFFFFTFSLKSISSYNNGTIIAGITAGYHRLWAHRSYNASLPLQYFLALAGTGAVEGSIKWWCRGHRAHHRYTDTDLDPYGAHHGLLWSHVGWMVVKPRRKPGVADISDLSRNPVVRWQHRHYIPLLIIMGLIVPMAIAGLGWGDWRGGFFYAGAARLVFVHHVS